MRDNYTDEQTLSKLNIVLVYSDEYIDVQYTVINHSA